MQRDQLLILQAVTPGGVYEQMANVTRANALDLGYSYDRVELLPSDDLRGQEPPCTFKPRVVLNALFQHRQPVYADEPNWIVWIDADAILVRPIDDIAGNWDVAVTLRERHMINHSPSEHMKFLNAGVIAIKADYHGLMFVQAWLEMTALTQNDQGGLNYAVARDLSPDGWRGLYGQTIEASIQVDSSQLRPRVRILDAVGGGWNNWLFPHGQLPDSTRIAHFKGELRDRLDWAGIVRQAGPAEGRKG